MRDRKTDLLALLDVLADVPPPRPSKKRLAHDDVPVYRDGKKIGHVRETFDPELEQWQARRHSIELLRQLLESGADPYTIAWHAMEVGGGLSAPDSERGRRALARTLKAASKTRRVSADIEDRIRALRAPGDLSDADIKRALAAEFGVGEPAIARYMRLFS